MVCGLAGPRCRRRLLGHHRTDAEHRADGSIGSGLSEDVLWEDRREVWGWGAEQHGRLAQAPVLVLWAPLGIVDPRQPLFSRKGLEELVKLLPDGRMQTADGANHLTIVLSRTSCQQVADATRSFNNRCD